MSGNGSRPAKRAVTASLAFAVAGLGCGAPGSRAQTETPTVAVRADQARSRVPSPGILHLRALFVDACAAARRGDSAAVVQFFRDRAPPDVDSARIAIAPTVSDSALSQALASARFSGSLEELQRACGENADVVVVLLQREQLTPSLREIFRSDVELFSVRLLPPGQELGFDYHAHFWDGYAWRGTQPIRRALRSLSAETEN